MSALLRLSTISRKDRTKLEYPGGPCLSHSQTSQYDTWMLRSIHEHRSGGIRKYKSSRQSRPNIFRHNYFWQWSSQTKSIWTMSIALLSRNICNRDLCCRSASARTYLPFFNTRHIGTLKILVRAMILFAMHSEKVLEQLGGLRDQLSALIFTLALLKARLAASMICPAVSSDWSVHLPHINFNLPQVLTTKSLPALLCVRPIIKSIQQAVDDTPDPHPRIWPLIQLSTGTRWYLWNTCSRCQSSDSIYALPKCHKSTSSFLTPPALLA